MALAVIDLGRMSYRDAHERQLEHHRSVLDARATGAEPGHVLLVEHDPVITVSRKAAQGENLLATPEMLHGAGVAVEPTDRGGDITYHGPGQLVCYPILDLERLGIRLHAYLRLLEAAVIETLAAFDVPAVRDAGATGVWIPGPDGAPRAKIAAIGVRVRRWVTLHGLALNVAPDLGHFGLIVPCGLQRPVTSLRAELGERCPEMRTVKARLVEALGDQVDSARTRR